MLPTILCGDWNMVMNFDQDTYSYLRENNIKAKKAVQNMINSFDLIDTWRVSHPDQNKYSWVSSKKPVKMARLDFFLVTPDIHALCTKSQISFGYRTDHSIISIDISLAEIQRHKGFWKLNTSLLYDEKYVNLVKNEIMLVKQEYMLTDNNGQNYIESYQDLYEVLKLRIRGVTIPYCSRKKKSENKREAELESKIMVWQGALQYAKKDSSLDPNLISSQIEVLQNEL